MSTKAIKEKPDKEHKAESWAPAREVAPSIVREDEPTLARWVGVIGLSLFVFGTAILCFNIIKGTPRLGPFNFYPGWGIFFTVNGLAALLFHAAQDRDFQIRRTYWIFGLACLAGALLAITLPVKESLFKGNPIAAVEVRFLKFGFPCLLLGLLFLLPSTRNETDPKIRQISIGILGLLGAAFALTGLIGGTFSDTFLLPTGLVLSLLGLGYLWAFIGLQGIADELGYRAALGMGAAGLIVFVVALGRSILPPLFYSWHWLSRRPEPYFLEGGLLLMIVGLLFLGVAVGLCSDHRLAVLTRRELGAFFYSPIAYVVFFGLTAFGWYLFLQFIGNLEQVLRSPRGADSLLEPIIVNYFLAFWPIFCLVFVVPVLTMRLMSEEHRTGTLEVLLTAPLGETAVVLSKFLATWLVFLLLWVPWGLFLIALRVENGKPFEYNPLICFFIVLLATGAGFVAMGLFFSSLTRNQIASAVLTFVIMLLLTMVFFVKRELMVNTPDSAWIPILSHISYVDLWIFSLNDGVLTPHNLLFHVSAAVFWLFLTIKVLESRKWR
ncbi:MAG TPA: ABC transporter permease [Gemmataceae bacterium]|nr:ABC transporter permease [Gemmataceae bacterium]